MKNTNTDNSTITTITALIIMAIITGVWTYNNVFSVEAVAHEKPIFDVIKSLLSFNFVAIIGGALLTAILVRLGLIIIWLLVIGCLLVTLLGAFPFLLTLLPPIVGLLILLGLYLVFSFATSKEADAECEPIQQEISKKCFYILIVINIFLTAILYNSYTNPNRNMWEFKPAIKAEEKVPIEENKTSENPVKSLQKD